MGTQDEAGPEALAEVFRPRGWGLNGRRYALGGRDVLSVATSARDVLSDVEEKTYPTGEAVVRLKDIGTWDPRLGQDKFMRRFCSYLGDRLNENIVPSGFATAFFLLVEDARRGKDGFTGKAMPQELTGQHPMVYTLCMRLQAGVARTAFGEEFGDLVDVEIKAMGL